MLVNFLCFVWMCTSIFLMLVILIQRGKGGGLAGAFGAVGGSSAFGTRAGDTMTKITVGVFLFWLLQAAILVRLMGTSKLAGEIGKLGGGVEAKKVLDSEPGANIVPEGGRPKAPLGDAGASPKDEPKSAAPTDGKSAAPAATKPIMPAPPPPNLKADEPKPTADAKATKPATAPPAKDAKKN